MNEIITNKKTKNCNGENYDVDKSGIRAVCQIILGKNKRWNLWIEIYEIEYLEREEIWKLIDSYVICKFYYIFFYEHGTVNSEGKHCPANIKEIKYFSYDDMILTSQGYIIYVDLKTKRTTCYQQPSKNLSQNIQIHYTDDVIFTYNYRDFGEERKKLIDFIIFPLHHKMFEKYKRGRRGYYYGIEYSCNINPNDVARFYITRKGLFSLEMYPGFKYSKYTSGYALAYLFSNEDPLHSMLREDVPLLDIRRKPDEIFFDLSVLEKNHKISLKYVIGRPDIVDIVHYNGDLCFLLNEEEIVMLVDICERHYHRASVNSLSFYSISETHRDVEYQEGEDGFLIERIHNPPLCIDKFNRRIIYNYVNKKGKRFIRFLIFCWSKIGIIPWEIFENIMIQCLERDAVKYIAGTFPNVI